MTILEWDGQLAAPIAPSPDGVLGVHCHPMDQILAKLPTNVDPDRGMLSSGLAPIDGAIYPYGSRWVLDTR